MKADLPLNEIIRLKALHDLAILDTPREQNFDDLAHIAMRMCDAPIAVVSLVDTDRQWFKSCLGLDATETSRDVAFCAHAILTPDDVLIVEDATKDIRFVDNALVTGEPHIRFYAGAPLVTEEGFAIGTLCVIDYVPRTLTEIQINTLKALARQVIQLLKLKTAHDAMQQYSSRLQSIADSVPVLIGELDSQSRYVFANKKYQDWFCCGNKKINLLGKTHREILPSDIAEKMLVAINECKQGNNSNLEVSLPSGTELSISYIPHKVNEYVGVYEIAMDITERKKIEQTKTEFISTVSHELRTPLTSITGALSLVANSMLGALPEKAQGMLNIAYRNSQRLTLLINDLLDMEKLIAGKMHFDLKSYPLLPLVQQAVMENKSYADKYNVVYRINNHIDSAQANIDGFRLQQVLCNFLSNAAKYSEPNMSVDVDLTRVDGWLRISVRDYGSGVPEEFKEQLFQKFSQADSSDTRQKGGTGLGLAVNKELTERMGGRVGFDRGFTKGACFYAEFREVFE